MARPRGGLPLGCGFLIQPQIALAGLGVGTMALKALIREDGENILAEAWISLAALSAPWAKRLNHDRAFHQKSGARQAMMERPIVGLKCICQLGFRGECCG